MRGLIFGAMMALVGGVILSGCAYQEEPLKERLCSDHNSCAQKFGNLCIQGYCQTVACQTDLNCRGYGLSICDEGQCIMGTRDCLDEDGDEYFQPSDDCLAEPFDCDDSNPDINPGADEACNGIDDNCNEQTDEGLETTLWFRDNDSDLFGDPDESMEACEQPEGFVVDNTDCDDTEEDINPNADEVCDDVDHDCDGNRFGWFPVETYYQDDDGDDFGRNDSFITHCAKPRGYAEVSGDCNDEDASIHPGAEEVCDGYDNDCAGGVDDGLETITSYLDEDGDGFGQTDQSVTDCKVPEGYAALPGDCNDDPVTGPNVNSVGREIGGEPDENGYCQPVDNCDDGIDNDCDGLIDTDDWDCQDTLDAVPDGIPNGIDAFYDLDTDDDGRVETLCIIAEYVFSPEYAQYGAVRQGTPINSSDDDSSWLGYEELSLDLTTSYEEVPGTSGALHAYCYDFSPEENDVNHIFRLVSERSALDSSQAVNELECTEWQPMDVSCSCRAFQSERYCRFGLSSRDLCDNVVGDVAAVSWDTITGLDRL